MVVLTVGLRTVMTICAVALVDAMAEDRTSIGTALNDTAQEVGTSVGTAVVGTLIAVLVTASLPSGAWSTDLVASFFQGERITYAALAVIVGLVAGCGALNPDGLALGRGTGLTLPHAITASARASSGRGSGTPSRVEPLGVGLEPARHEVFARGRGGRISGHGS